MEITVFVLVCSILVVILALAFAFSTGFNEPNVAAVVISTKAMPLRTALLVVSFLEFAGACLLGTAVAKTFAVGIIDPNIVSESGYGIMIILVTLLVATSWNVICTILGFPISASLSLIGGFVGAGIAAAGFGVIQWSKIFLIFGFLVTSPILGLTVSFLVTKFAYLVVQKARPSIKNLFIWLEIVTTIGLALVTGANAAQRPMGIIVFTLIIVGLYKPTAEFFVPTWVTITCGLFLALGVLSTSRKVLRTVGRGYYRIRHINGVCAQLASAGIIQIANIIGTPVSTTQITSSSVIGTGAAEGIKGVRWGVGFRVLAMWLITMPSTAIVSYLLYILAVSGLKHFGV
jgi:PiT family inorganic phosphate transporter